MCTGFSDVIGSWKIIAMSLPRMSRSRRDGIVSRSSPLKSASPLVIVFRLAFRPMIVRQVTLLPRARLADDAERLALLDREADAVDGLDDAVVRAEVGLQVLDLEERHQRAISQPDSRVDRRRRAGRRPG